MSAAASARRTPPPPPRPGASPVERRKHERRELLAHVELRKQGEVALLAVANISAGGLLLRSDPGEVDVAKGEQVSVFLDLADQPMPMCVTLNAVVVRVTPSSAPTPGPTMIALMWSQNEAATIAQLKTLVASLPA